mmetsp:Transcript_90809/g.243200  ORF Transcript_90809/g.243200 Transcript_90809/m.243200 type:complete len:195 (-) Transcript_90809:133-717(-)
MRDSASSGVEQPKRVAPQDDGEHAPKRLAADTSEAPVVRDDSMCKFYAAGYCARGRSCWYAHVPPKATQESAAAWPVKPVVCKYFMSGWCGYGENCQFSHQGEPISQPPAVVRVKPVAESIPQAQIPPCRFYSTVSGCKAGSKCPFRHDKHQEVGKAEDPGAVQKAKEVLGKYSISTFAEDRGSDVVVRKQPEP